MVNYPIIQSDHLKQSIEHYLEQVRARLDVFGFAIWPLNPDPEHGIPAGFCTIGFTRIGLPEFYVSGIPGNSAQADKLISNMKELYAYARDTGQTYRSFDLCMEINMSTVVPDEEIGYQYRPIDPTRMMYGQCLTLRNWAESEDLVDQVQGIQIVHRRAGENQFPMVTTPEQLLLDWVPFGTKGYSLELSNTQSIPTVDKVTQ